MEQGGDAVEQSMFFEIGTVFTQNGSLKESSHVAAVACGDVEPEQWAVKSHKTGFFDLKGESF